MAFAHSQNSRDVRHDLETHLRAVAGLAAQYAGKFAAADLGYWAGLWHDLGKFHPAFQAYLANPVGARGPDHKRAGAILASKYANSLAFLIAGHHGGLQDREALKGWLRGKPGDTASEEALAIARSEVSGVEPVCSPCFPP